VLSQELTIQICFQRPLNNYKRSSRTCFGIYYH